jgi:hypothetical protein
MAGEKLSDFYGSPHRCRHCKKFAVILKEKWGGGLPCKDDTWEPKRKIVFAQDYICRNFDKVEVEADANSY